MVAARLTARSGLKCSDALFELGKYFREIILKLFDASFEFLDCGRMMKLFCRALADFEVQLAVLAVQSFQRELLGPGFGFCHGAPVDADRSMNRDFPDTSRNMVPPLW